MVVEGPLGDGAHTDTVRGVGSVADASDVTVSATVNGGESIHLEVDEAGDFDGSLGAALGDGAHEVTITATDAAGNSSSTVVQFQVVSEFVVGPEGGDGWGIVTDDALTLYERDSSVVQVQKVLEMPLTDGSRTLRFNLDAEFDLSAGGELEDQVLIYLIDAATGEPLIGNGEAGTAAFSLVGDAADFTPGLVTFDGSVVEMDLTEIVGVEQALLVVQLVNGDSDSGSVVRLTDVMVDIDDGGQANPVFERQDIIGSIGEAIDLSLLSEAEEGSIETRFSTIRFDAETGGLYRSFTDSECGG